MSNTNTALTPMEPALSIIPFTYEDNKINASWEKDKVSLSINGSDLIITTGDNRKLILTMGAELASLNGGVLSLAFNDGKKLNSYEIMSLAKIEDITPEIIETKAPEQLTTKEDDITVESVEDKTVDLTTNMTDNFIVIDTSGGADTSSNEIQSSLENMMDLDMQVKPTKLKSPHADIVFKKSSSSSSDSEKYQSSIDGEVPIVESKPPASITPKMPNVKLYQWEGLIDSAQHVYDVGGGNLSARTDVTANAQYSTTLVDLSQENADWTVNVANQNYIEEGKILRIVSFDDAQSIGNITGLPSDYQIIRGGTAQGDKYGLSLNEIIIVYPKDQINKFSISVTYTDSNGKTVTEDFNFSVVDSPSSLIDIDGNILLSSSANNVHVVGGAGDDVIIAGTTQDIYDGGAGINTVDYSQVKGDLIIDLHTKTVTGAVNQQVENIQNIIGNNGDNTFIGSLTESNNLIGGDGKDIFFVGGGKDNQIDGKGGINTISYETTDNGVNVDLTKGTVTDAFGRNDSIRNINNITGTRFDDVLIGDDKDNIIIGNGGNDILIGMGGNNTLIGGNGGNSTASYQESAKGINVDLSKTDKQVINNGFDGSDTLKNIQSIKGSQHDDIFKTAKGSITIYGGEGNDTFYIEGDAISRAVIHGEAGNNLYVAGQGYNSFIGGTGIDVVDYHLATSAIDVNLKTRRAYSNGFGGADQLTNINGIVGTDFDDRIELANDTNYLISTGAGDDYLIVGKGGMSNYYDGGDGVDTIDYSNVANGIEISLKNQVATKNGTKDSNGNDGVDRVSNFENIVGSAFDDIIEGSDADNIIHVGGGSENIIYGSLGNDQIIAKGNGTNTLDYSRYSIVAQNSGIEIDATNGTVIKDINGQAFQDSFTAGGFTKFVGTEYDDTFIINQSTTFVDGSGGTNSLILDETMQGSYIVDLENNRITANNYNAEIKNINNVTIKGGTLQFYGNETEGNTVIAGAGDDHIHAKGGDNFIDGGAGNDWLYYDDGIQGVVVSLDANGNGTATNGFGGKDTIKNIENIHGSQYDDIISGKGILIGGDGNNTLIGIGNNAVVQYKSPNGIKANLDTGIVSDNGYGKEDRIVNIHKIIGTDKDDEFYGSSVSDEIHTGAGNDIVYGSSGNDRIVNTSGNTKIDYTNLREGIRVYVTNNKDMTVSKGNWGRDTLTSITDISGTNFNDEFQFTSLSDFNRYHSIDGGLGIDSVTKKGRAGTFDFSVVNKNLFKHIDIFNFKDGVAGDFILVNLSDLFENMDNNNIRFDTDSTDSLQILDSAGTWVHSEISPGVDQWTDGTHTLTWNHV